MKDKSTTQPRLKAAIYKPDGETLTMYYSDGRKESNVSSDTFTHEELRMMKLSIDTITEDGIQSPFPTELLRKLSNKIQEILNQNVKS